MRRLGGQNMVADVSALRVALMTSQLGQGSTIWQTVPFTMEGTLTAGAKLTRFYMPAAMTIDKVYISVHTAPTGAPGVVTVDVNKNGVTIFTNQANRPSIAATKYTAESGIPDITALAKNDYLTFDIDAIGATVPGEYLTVHVRCQYGITGGATDLVTHAALQTGVHGAGASTLATAATLATHAAVQTGLHGLAITAGKVLTATESLTLNALPIGGLAVATAADTLGSLAVGTVGQYLRGAGAGTVPIWSTLLLPNAATAFRLPVATAANTIGELAAVGATGEYLAGATGAIPAWATLNQAAVAGLLASSNVVHHGLAIGHGAATDHSLLVDGAATVTGLLTANGGSQLAQGQYHRMDGFAGGTGPIDWRFRISGPGSEADSVIWYAESSTGSESFGAKIYFGPAGDINVVGVYKVDGVQVVGNRVVDARCDDAINSGDATTDGVIDALRDAMITHGLIAAA